MTELKLFRFFLLGVMLINSKLVYGSKSDEFPTLSAYAYGGYAVYKSEMVQSNDTAFTIGYGFELFAGREHEFGMGLSRESSQLGFALNNSKISIDTDLFKVTYSLGPVWFGPIFSYTLWEVAAPPDLDSNEFLDQNTASEPYLGASSQGMGVHGGLDFFLGKKTLVHLKLANISTTQALQETPAETSQAGVVGTSPSPQRRMVVGSRTDADIGALILLSRESLHLLFGFKATTYQVSIEDKAFSEVHNTTYLGLMGSWYF